TTWSDLFRCLLQDPLLPLVVVLSKYVVQPTEAGSKCMGYCRGRQISPTRKVNQT
ncbi:hypothetical protein L9F63_014103, partial [Diploptera punctata]